MTDRIQVRVAGYNVDADLLDRFRSLLRDFAVYYEGEEIDRAGVVRSFLAMDNLTPETLCAAYARISRDPAQIGVLRNQACHAVARARHSNQKIIFDYGHASVAEHAVFNVDVCGISRLATEEIESRRLISFTEKSQRYIAMQREYVIPPEIKNTPLESEFAKFCDELFENYVSFLPVLEKYFDSQGVKRPDLSAREDARYILPLAAAAQFGMTANARNIEHLIRRTINHPLAELRQFAQNLKTDIEKTAPSLIKHIEEDDRKTDLFTNPLEAGAADDDVKLVYAAPEGDKTLTAALIFRSEPLSWAEARDKAGGMNEHQRKSYIAGKIEGLKAYDAMPREYELMEFGYQLKLSASAYAQLKRHRLSTQLVKPYNPALGFTIPESIIGAGLKDRFIHCMEQSEAVHGEIIKTAPACASYALTNAHRRIMYLQANAREMYHISRLRMDSSAQWDIRNMAAKMVELAAQKAPLTMALACGKDRFEEKYREFRKK